MVNGNVLIVARSGRVISEHSGNAANAGLSCRDYLPGYDRGDPTVMAQATEIAKPLIDLGVGRAMHPLLESGEHSTAVEGIAQHNLALLMRLRR